MINKKIATEILAHVRIDHQLRHDYLAGKREWDYGIDINNTKYLKTVIKEYGWPTVQLVGKKASFGAWYLVQHADHDLSFQKKVLIMLEKIYKEDNNNIDFENIKFLTDRILFSENKPQKYNTQFRGRPEKI